MADSKRTFFTAEEEAHIINAIQEAEKQTSGEIKVHVEEHCYIDLLDRSAEVFAKLEMHQTSLRNGALIYVAIEDHLFSVIGDAGINEVVEPNFWDDIRDIMQEHFAAGQIVEGLAAGIKRVGEKLKKHFPYQSNDTNELPDDISYG